MKRAYREGHTIGTHTEHHARLDHATVEKAQKEISDGLASAEQVLGDKNAVAPFFRFPYFYTAAAAEERALQLGLNIWSADVDASDWTFITAEKVNALALARLESNKKGILLLHDIHDRTARALPALLRELKKRGFRVVHVVPASGAVAKIDVKPDEKSAANTDEKTAVANQEPNAAEKVKQVTPVNLNKKNGQSGWQTHLKRSRAGNNVTAMSKSKKTGLQSLIDSLWH